MFLIVFYYVHLICNSYLITELSDSWLHLQMQSYQGLSWRRSEEQDLIFYKVERIPTLGVIHHTSGQEILYNSDYRGL